MVDPDDVEAIALESALRELLAAARRLPDPEFAIARWMDMTVAVLMHQQLPGRPLSWVLCFTARRVRDEVLASL